MIPPPQPMQPVIIYPLVMTNSLLLKMAIYSGFTHWKWSLSIVMLVYQRVLLWSAFANSRNRTQWRDVVSCGFPKTDGFSLGAVLQTVVHRSPTQSWSVSGINIKYGYWLVVLTILKILVNGKDYPHISWKIKHVWNHQPGYIWINGEPIYLIQKTM